MLNTLSHSTTTPVAKHNTFADNANFGAHVTHILGTANAITYRLLVTKRGTSYVIALQELIPDKDGNMDWLTQEESAVMDIAPTHDYLAHLATAPNGKTMTIVDEVLTQH